MGVFWLYMNTLRHILWFPFILLTGCPASNEQTITLGMTESEVVASLEQLGANDISAEMSVTAGARKSHWMWDMDSPKISLETLFEKGSLKTLNLWDWRTRELNRYHHLMEYDEISEVTINPHRSEFTCDIVATHNPGEH